MLCLFESLSLFISWKLISDTVYKHTKNCIERLNCRTGFAVDLYPAHTYLKYYTKMLCMSYSQQKESIIRFWKEILKIKWASLKIWDILRYDFASFASLTSGYPIIICSELIFWIIKILLLELAVFQNKKDKFLTMLLFFFVLVFCFLDKTNEGLVYLFWNTTNSNYFLNMKQGLGIVCHELWEAFGISFSKTHLSFYDSYEKLKHYRNQHAKVCQPNELLLHTFIEINRNWLAKLNIIVLVAFRAVTRALIVLYNHISVLCSTNVFDNRKLAQNTNIWMCTPPQLML